METSNDRNAHAKGLEGVWGSLSSARWFWAALSVTTLWRIVAAGRLGICLDEGYYHFWSLSPQLSYFDHPPLTAWAMYLSGKLFGDSVWTVRFWPLVAGTAFILIGRALARRMFGEPASNRAGILLSFVPVFAGNGLIMTPDTLLALFWASGLLCAWNGLESPQTCSYWWLLTGLSVGFGLLSKYTMILFFGGMVVLWVIAPSLRKKIFAGVLASGCVALLVFSPVIVWNVQNHWLSFRFQLGHGFAGKSSSLFKHLASYIGILFVIATPLLGLMSFWSSGRGLKDRDPRTRFHAAFFIAVIGFFGVAALRSYVEANWPMLAFFSGVILAAHYWPTYHLRVRQATIGLLLASCFVIGTYALLPSQFPIVLGGKSLDLERMEEFTGGPELAQAVRNTRADKNLDFIYTNSHQLLGRLSFYGPDLRPFLCPSVDGRHRYPWIDDRQWNGRSALIVTTSDTEWKVLAAFKDIQLLGTIDIPYKKLLKQTFYLYAGTGYTSIPMAAPSRKQQEGGAAS